MHVLSVDWKLPRADQSSGELRVVTLLGLLAKSHRVDVLSIGPQRPCDAQAAAQLQARGLLLAAGPLEACLARTRYDLVIAEFHGTAAVIAPSVRAFQPWARLVCDSVDVHFHRLRTKAQLTGAAADRAQAEAEFAAEMHGYRAADLVTTVSPEDGRLLVEAGLETEQFVLPNLHAMHPLQPRAPRERLDLIFIGGYGHEPNVDAVSWFCRDVLPRVRARVPALRLRLVGSNAPPQVHALAAADVEVIGFVPETTSCLATSDISIAPLRFGAGLNGKIGEALAHGLPVVTTSLGATGFGFVAGRDFLVADTAAAFADAIVALHEDRALYERVRHNGWQRIDERFSIDAFERRLPQFLRKVESLQPQRLSTYRRMRTRLQTYLRSAREPAHH